MGICSAAGKGRSVSFAGGQMMYCRCQCGLDLPPKVLHTLFWLHVKDCFFFKVKVGLLGFGSFSACAIAGIEPKWSVLLSISLPIFISQYH